MKHKVTFLAILMMALAWTQSVFAYDFSAVAPSGQTLYYNIVDGEAQVTYQNSSYPYYNSGAEPTGDLTIPDTVTYNGTTYIVTSIDDYTFYECSGLTSVNIPNSVTSIGYYAFMNCSGLTSVSIGNGVTTIGKFVFSGCSGLTSITIPNSVTSIGYYTFSGCSGLTSITIPNSVTSIGDQAFRNCSSLTSITIPNSVTSIGDNAFAQCSGLTSVNIPNSVTSIGVQAFWDCSGLTSVSIGNGVTTIGESVFQNCSSLTSITIPNSVTSIGYYAFSGCSSLTTVTIPNSVTSIEFSAFMDCSSLISVTIPHSVTTIGDQAFINCSGLTSITIPNSVTSIGKGVFSGCSGLTSVTIPNSVTSIDYYAFQNCSSLTSITIPNGVTSIGFYAFEGCSSLVEIWMKPTTPPSLSWSSFNNDTIPLVVPYGSFDAYANAGEYYSSHPIYRDTIFINVAVNDAARGFGNDTALAYPYLDTMILVATPNYGYHFDHWDDNTTDSTCRIINVTNDSTRTAYFEKNIYTLTFESDDTIMGIIDTMSISGEYLDSTIQVFASALPHYHFVRWNDDNTDNPRQFVFDADRTYTAFFEKNIYLLTFESKDTTMGTVDSTSTSGRYLETSAPIFARALPHYHFVRWNDDNTDNPRQFLFEDSITYTAYFEKDVYDLAFQSDDTTMGTVDIASTSGRYLDTTVAITATALPHYHFVRWNDDNTDNPRQFIIEDSSTYTAYFEKNIYTLTFQSNDTTMGSVDSASTSGRYLETSSPILARALQHYHFVRWNDDNTDNPRQFLFEDSITYTAYFEKDVYDLAFQSDDTTMGTVDIASTSGRYLDTTVAITATALPHYHFVRWNDGSTDNPRQFIIEDSSTYTAYFEKNIYTLTFQSNDSTMGIVDSASTSGRYLETSDPIFARALPHYHFVRWNDDNTDNPRQFVFEDSITYTAYFEKDVYDLAFQSNDTTMGHVDIASTSGRYLDTTVAITATALPHYHFVRWNDGSTDNPRQFVIEDSITYTAYFEKNIYLLSFESKDTTMGTVDSTSTSGRYLGTSAPIFAHALPHYHFVRWNDDNTDNPRQFVFEDSITYTAYFEKDVYDLAFQSDNTTMGTVDIASTSGRYLDTTVAITATALPHYHFVRWNDNNTDNPRQFVIEDSLTYTAYFEKNIYTLTFQSNDTTMGSVDNALISGGYLDTTAQVLATAMPHYHFVRWNDDNTDNPRQFVIEGNSTYTANFAIDEYTVTVAVDDIAHGTVSEGGTREYGQPITISATPYSGYQFTHWSDGTTYNPYTFAVTGDITLTAEFIAEGESWQDTVVIHDTLYQTRYDTLTLHDTITKIIHATFTKHDTIINTVYDTVTLTDTVINNIHDTVTLVDTITNTVYDTVTLTDTVTNTVHDTLTLFDTIINTVYDTLTLTDTITNTVHDTITVTQYDTITNTIHDTVTVTLTQYDTITNTVHDTITVTVTDTVTNTVFDTVTVTEYDTITNTVHDTITVTVTDTVTNTVFDTVTVTEYDTITNTVTDTVTLTQYDTITNTVTDTVMLTDTLWMTQTDTIWMTDTVVVHDTIYVSDQGVDGVEALNAKVYTHQGQIVVEGADGNTVSLFDINGRLMATKQDFGTEIRFDAPASGTYMIKIGNHAAKRVVLIR